MFVSRLVGGTFQPPEQVDAEPCPAPRRSRSSPPANDGLLTIAFINAGGLYEVTRLSAADPYGAATGLFAGAANPSLQMTLLGKAYIAFTAAGAGGHDVRTAYFNGAHWALGPLAARCQSRQTTPERALAGRRSRRPATAWRSCLGRGRPHLHAAGVGRLAQRGLRAGRRSVAWGDGRRSQPTSRRSGRAAIPPTPSVVFHEVLSNGSAQQSRVLMRRLRASAFDPVSQPDGVSTPSGAQADQPALAVSEYGRGFVTSAQTNSNQLFAAHLDTNGAPGDPFRVDSLQNASLPYATPATAGLTSTLIAWQQDPGLPATPEIRAPLRAGRSQPRSGARAVNARPGSHRCRGRPVGRRRCGRKRGRRLGSELPAGQPDRRGPDVPAALRVRSRPRVRVRPHVPADAELDSGPGSVGSDSLHGQRRRRPVRSDVRDLADAAGAAGRRAPHAGR